MATIRSLRRRWRAKQYISAAMLGTLFVIALVATTSISLAPAHISFYIQDTNITTYPERHNNTHLNFTLVANNTSQRTAVRFTSMIAEIWYGPAATAWIRTHVHEKAGLPAGWQPPRSMVRINVSADYGYDRMSNVTNDCSVVVESKVWFRFGLASTRPFTVRFSCLNVNFSDHNIFPVLCG